MLVEVCVALIVISLMTLIYLPYVEIANMDYFTFGDSYLNKQSEAIAGRKRAELDQDEASISFNAKGNVDQARTIIFNDRSIVVELGGGKLVYQ